MRLKLGEPTEASALYAKLDALSLTPRQAEMAHTKRRMSADLQASRSADLLRAESFVISWPSSPGRRPTTSPASSSPGGVISRPTPLPVSEATPQLPLTTTT